MSVKVTISHTNNNPDTIWNRLAAKLGREPTMQEARDEVKRIMSEQTVDLATAGKLPHQRRRRR